MRDFFFLTIRYKMPFRKYKKKTYKKKRVFRRKYTRKPRGILVKNDVHHFIRSSSDPIFASITGGVSTQQNFAWTFNLHQVRNYTEFTNLFDQFRINKIILKFFLYSDPSAQTANTAVYPRMWYCPDYDDDAPLTIDVLRERQKTRVAQLKPGRPVKIRVTPASLAMMYGGVASTSYMPVFKRWVDTNYGGTPHYGLKFAFEDGALQTWQVRVEAVYSVSFKNSR